MRTALFAAALLSAFALPSRAFALGPLWSGSLGVKVTDVDGDGVLSAGDELEVTTSILCSGEGQQAGLYVNYPLGDLVEPVADSVAVTGDGSSYAAVVTGNLSTDRQIYVAYDDAAFAQNNVSFTVRIVDPIPASLPSTNVTFRGDFSYIVDYWDDAAGNLTEATATNTVSFYLGQSLVNKTEYTSTLVAKFKTTRRGFDFDTEKIFAKTFPEEVTIYNAGPYDVSGLEIWFSPVDFANTGATPAACTWDEEVQPHFCVAYDPRTCTAPFAEAVCLREAELKTYKYEGTLATGQFITVTWDTHLNDRNVDLYAEVATYAVTITATVLAPSTVSMTSEQSISTEYTVVGRLAEQGAMSPLAAVFPLLFLALYLVARKRS